MRWALLAASVAAAAITANVAFAQEVKREPASQQGASEESGGVTPVAALRATAPPNAAASHADRPGSDSSWVGTTPSDR